MFRAEPLPSASGPEHLHGTRTQSFGISDLSRQFVNRAFVFVFFSGLADFSISVSQLHRGVQSPSDLVPDPLLYLEKIHFCQEEHEKPTVLSRDQRQWLFAQT